MIFNESGGTSLNFKVIGGTAEPGNPIVNTIWVNTDREITGWHFGADEPNVYNIQAVKNDDPWNLNLPDGLTAGKRVNFTIPLTVSSAFEAIRFYHAGTDRMYCVRNWDGSAVNQWPAGMKVCVILSDNINKIGEWSGNGTAYFVGSPYVHEEGTVWITTGTSSSVAFNALKKNTIMVYPLSAKQYISGAWVDKTARSYQGGAWVDWWSGQLYEYGKQYEAQTGGWTTEEYVYEKWSTLATFNSSNMYIYFEMGVGVGGVGTRKKINLSGYSTLKAIVTPTSNTLHVCALANKSDDMASTYIARKSVSAGSQQTVTLDIATVNEAYIGFATMGNATIHAVWLE